MQMWARTMGLRICTRVRVHVSVCERLCGYAYMCAGVHVCGVCVRVHVCVCEYVSGAVGLKQGYTTTKRSFSVMHDRHGKALTRTCRKCSAHQAAQATHAGTPV